MTLFRVRRYGSVDWTEIEVRDEDGEGMESEISQRMRTMLSDTGLHAQECNEQGEWEDLL